MLSSEANAADDPRRKPTVALTLIDVLRFHELDHELVTVSVWFTVHDTVSVSYTHLTLPTICSV